MIYLAVLERCRVDTACYIGEACCSLVSRELLDSKDHILLIFVQPLFNIVPACIQKLLNQCLDLAEYIALLRTVSPC